MGYYTPHTLMIAPRQPYVASYCSNRIKPRLQYIGLRNM